VTILLDAGADPDAPAAGGRMALHLAAGNGHLEVVKLLVARGAEVDAHRDRGYTPLHAAARGQPVVRVLAAAPDGGEDG
jgi:ankyrin repeat protein